MSRSFRSADGIPGGLADRLLRECLPPGHVIDDYCYCEAPFTFHYTVTYDSLIPLTAVASRLIRHGWPPRRAHRVLEYASFGYLYGHDHKLYRRDTWRAYRRDFKVKVATGREDEICDFQETRGWDSW